MKVGFGKAVRLKLEGDCLGRVSDCLLRLEIELCLRTNMEKVLVLIPRNLLNVY
jgi:hypothetical protein